MLEYVGVVLSYDKKFVFTRSGGRACLPQMLAEGDLNWVACKLISQICEDTGDFDRFAIEVGARQVTHYFRTSLTAGQWELVEANACRGSGYYVCDVAAVAEIDPVANVHWLVPMALYGRVPLVIELLKEKKRV